MKKQALLDKFDEIYNKTYKNTLKYVLLHCNDLDDVSDIIQDTYFDFYKYLARNKVKNKIIDIDNYIIGISKNILKKYYHQKSKNFSIISISKDEEPITLTNPNIDLELQFITKENSRNIWEYIKNKDIKIAKIFYCYYYLDMKIIEIAIEMQLNESSVKNYIYRTIKELQNKFKKED